MLLTTICGLLPASRLKNAFLRRLGHRIARDARIGPVLIVRSRLQVGSGARIGAMNVFRGLRVAEIAEHAEMGQWNWISAAPFLVDNSSSAIAGEFHLGPSASLTSRHYVDASGGVSIGAFATIAGVRSVFMTHGIDVRDNVLDTAPIIVGDYAMVGSCTNFVLGATVPAHSVIGMGALVLPGLERTHALYTGVPATFKKEVPVGEYGTRIIGPVPPRRAGAPALVR